MKNCSAASDAAARAAVKNQDGVKKTMYVYALPVPDKSTQLIWIV